MSRPRTWNNLAGQKFVEADDSGRMVDVTARSKPDAERVQGEVAAAVRRAAEVGPLAYTQAMTDPTVPHVWQHVTTNVLAAALPTECHESVPHEWADGDEGPCNSEHVVGYRLDEDHPYPVCADHMRPPMVSLRAALLGGAA